MIGRRIKELRTEKGLTQQELAEILNVSSMSISFYENEQRKTSTHRRYDWVPFICDRRLFVCGDREKPKHRIHWADGQGRLS